MKKAKLKEADIIKYGVKIEDLPPPEKGTVDIKSWFGEERKNFPLELEIGTYKGTFLSREAGKNPAVNYTGIEWATRYWKWAIRKCSTGNLDNVKIVRGEAKNFIRSYIDNNTVRQIHVYFPDPWPKRKHKHRRLIQEDFLKELYRILEQDGIVKIITDHPEYFDWIKFCTVKMREQFEEIPFEKPLSAEEEVMVGSNFELKYKNEGRIFHSISLKKK